MPPAACCHTGPGYASPAEAAKNGPRETLVYLPAVVADHSRPDYLATVDVDPESSSYGQVIHRLPMPHKGDELHHSGWNACSSCFSDPSAARSSLILPALGSGRIYAVDTVTDPRAPRIRHVAEPEDIQKSSGLAYLHTSHCLGSGDIMVSAMGDPEGGGRGAFLLLDQQLKVKGTWSEQQTQFGYDFWYQPRLNVMISTGWGAPSAFSKGFDPSLVSSHYNSKVFIWDWQQHTLVQELELGGEGLIPLEVRFQHEPSSPHAFVGAALSSNLIHITRAQGQVEGGKGPGTWEAKAVFKQEWTSVEGWVLPAVPPLITDILISMDDKWLYLSNWLRGDIVQLDISDPANPRVAARLFVGGLIRKDGPLKVTGGLPEGLSEAPEVPLVKGNKLRGGPQMIQLSLDGRRLYVTNSLYSPWDKQFYPDMVKAGSTLLMVDVDNEKGGLALNPDFYVDFGAEPDGPALAHEVRYPGGDCSSDIWL
ncbi:selenium binding protein [Haematococcus lacustris]